MQEDNNNNPFQINQPRPVRVDDFDEADPTPLPQDTSWAEKRPPVALDGVSPNYINEDYVEPSAGTESVSEPAPVVNTDNIEPESVMAPDTYDTIPQPPEPQPQPQPEPDNEYMNPLINPETIAPNNPITETPVLTRPTDTVVEIGPAAGGMRFKAWQFFLVLGLAIVGIAGAAFFFVEYNQMETSSQEAWNQIDEYRGKADTASRATQQLEDLQKTVREQADKITELKEDNDSLKKLEDELKSVKKDNESLKKEKEDIVNNCAKLL